MAAPNPNLKPFTVSDRVKRLVTIDERIVSLPGTLASALSSIAPPSVVSRANGPQGLGCNGASSYHPLGDPAQLSATDRENMFSDSMNKFLNDLHTISVLVKRELWALAEAGIITLPQKSADAAEESQPASQQDITGPSAALTSNATPEQRRPLGPDGRGMIGKLDVGLLNSQAGTVEEQLDRELWRKAREDLEAQLLKERQQQ